MPLPVGARLLLLLPHQQAVMGILLVMVMLPLVLLELVLVLMMLPLCCWFA
jgi:hypothetical protein